MVTRGTEIELSRLSVVNQDTSLLHHVPGVDEAAGLPLPQRCVVPVAAQQLIVRALLGDAAAIEHDPAGPWSSGLLAHGVEKRTDARWRSRSYHQRAEARLDRGLDLAVERRGSPRRAPNLEHCAGITCAHRKDVRT